MNETPTQRLVFFDMDGTLTRCNTGRIYAQSLWKSKELSTVQLIGVAFLLLRYRLGVVDMERIMDRLIRESAGKAESAVQNRCSQLVAQRVVPEIFKEAWERVRFHQERGDRLVILSASSSYMIRPLAQAMGILEILATPVHVRDGLFTGEYEAPICYGEGKVTWAKRYCDTHGFALEDAIFYTDSFTDLPLLEEVDEPIVVNPDLRLERIARQRGWPLERWTVEG